MSIADRGARLVTWVGTGLGTALLLGGVLSGAVTAEAMLVAAWLENLSAGGATLLALLRSPGGRIVLPANVQVSGIPVRREPDGSRSIPAGCAAGFFAGHFGLFTLVHGVFLGVVVVIGRGGGEVGLTRTAVVVIVVAALLRTLRRVDPRRAIAQAYAGLAPVHIGVLLTFATAVDLGASTGPRRGPALLVVGLLVVGDLVRAWIGRGASAQAAPGSVAVPPPPPPPPPAPRDTDGPTVPPPTAPPPPA